MKSLLSLYCLKYSDGCFKRRKYIVYFAVSLLTEKVDLGVELITAEQKTTMQMVLKNIGWIYRQVKENEKSPNTDYLFANMKQSNLDKTIEKLDKMNTIGDTFVPRV